MARRVVETGETEELRGLNSYERYLVHAAIVEQVDLDKVESISEDRDEERVLLIRLKK